MDFRTLWLIAAMSAAALGWPGTGAAQSAGTTSPASVTVQVAPTQNAPSVQTAEVVQTAQANAPQPPPSPAAVKILDEFKLGFLAHDVGIGGHHKEDGYDLNGEILFASPTFFKYIWSPRPMFGVDGNLNGKTSFYYAGLAWDWVFWRPGWGRNDGFFIDPAVGGSVNDGKISTTDPNRKSMGSHVLFREGLDLGYRFNSMVSLSSFIDHSSNAGIANRNEGITNFGMRVGFKF